MVRDLLLDIVNKWHIQDLILLLLLSVSFLIFWFTALALGLKILNVNIKLKRIIPGVLCLSFIALFIKPFTPAALAFFLILIPVILLIRFYSQTKWLNVCWVSFITVLASSVGPMLFISPISSADHYIGSFFFSRYGLPVMTLIEALGVVLLLVILNIFDISLVPDPKQPLKSIEFIAMYVLLYLCYLCYNLTIDIWKNWKNSIIFSMESLLKWTLAAAAIIGFSIYKSHIQKREKAKEQLIQELREEKNKKVGPQDIEEFSDRLQNTLKPADIDSEFPVYITSLPEMEFNDREQEILQLLAEGYSNPEIAKTLCLSTGRVANIISNNITPKTGLSERKLILYAAYWVKKYKKIP